MRWTQEGDLLPELRTVCSRPLRSAQREYRVTGQCGYAERFGFRQRERTHRYPVVYKQV